jgi:hypothetical protein
LSQDTKEQEVEVLFDSYTVIKVQIIQSKGKDKAIYATVEFENRENFLKVLRSLPDVIIKGTRVAVKPLH